MKKIFFIPSILVTLFFIACEKDGLKLAETMSVADKAYIKVGYYSPSPNNNFLLKFDTTKFGNTFFYSQLNPLDGTAYLAVPSGTSPARFVLPKVGTSEDSVVITNFSYNFEPGKYYSLFTIDTGNKVRALILSDNLTIPTDGKAKIRFVNTMYNVPAIDVKLSDGTMIAQGLAFGTATEFFELNAAQLSSFRFHNPGTSTQLTGTNASSFKYDITPTNQRIYTVVLRGIAGSSTTVPVITSIANR